MSDYGWSVTVNEVTFCAQRRPAYESTRWGDMPHFGPWETYWESSLPLGPMLSERGMLLESGDTLGVVTAATEMREIPLTR